MKIKKKATTVIGFIVGLYFIATCVQMLYNLKTFERDKINIAYEFGKAAKEVGSAIISGWSEN